MGSFKLVFILYCGSGLRRTTCHKKKTDGNICLRVKCSNYLALATRQFWKKIVSRQCNQEISLLQPRIYLVIFSQTRVVKYKKKNHVSPRNTKISSLKAQTFERNCTLVFSLSSTGNFVQS